MSRCRQVAELLLSQCLSLGPRDNRLVDYLVSAECVEIFSIVAEGLSDRFDPALCDAYIDLFATIAARLDQTLNASDLKRRARVIATPRQFQGEIDGIFVLSRVTLGADVSITSVVLDGLKQRFPRSRIAMVGGRNIAELYAADPRIEFTTFQYSRRASCRALFSASAALRSIVDRPGWIVVDPDSRMTQLGLIPVCDDARYYFFPSRSYGGASKHSLTELTQTWMRETFGVEESRQYVAQASRSEPVGRPAATVSFGVGGNQAKRVSEEFESAILRHLLKRGFYVYVDAGADDSERMHADHVCALAGGFCSHLLRHDGTAGELAALIQSSDMYIGYDSSGQHIAAALSAPFVSVFVGAPSVVFYDRWRPSGRGIGRTVTPSGETTANLLHDTTTAIDSLAVELGLLRELENTTAVRL
jgi:ADP-heptose:LPS heptosyltransferase